MWFSLDQGWIYFVLRSKMVMWFESYPATAFSN